jgi:ketosteroid isomerase-like protein
VCTHPGWRVLRGWDTIRDSYAAIFRGQRLPFIVTDTDVQVEGQAAWVTCDENLWGEQITGTVSALNLFVRDPLDGQWRMVAHHASPVPPSAEDEGPDT